MSNDIRLHNCIRDILCSGCSLEVRKECYRQTEDERYDAMIWCIKRVLDPCDEKYPAEVPHVRKHSLRPARSDKELKQAAKELEEKNKKRFSTGTDLQEDSFR
jgi:hypothetical protein